MGCCSGNENFTHENKDPLKGLTKDICLKSLESSLIDKKVQEYSSNGVIAPLSFKDILRDLALDRDKLDYFFRQFYNGYYYFTKKISTLGVLLGNGTINQKNKNFIQELQ